jgi:hypothetical protein
VINKRTDFKGGHQVKNDQNDENHNTVKSFGINDLIGRQLKEPTHIDQLFVELSTGLTLSILERHFDINLPDGCPKASLAPLDVFEALSSGPFGILSQYLDSLADPDERNRLAEIALGPPMQQHFSPIEKELTIDVHELGRQLVKEAEYLCDALDDRPIIHLLATELQHKASEMWYTPPPRFCLIDSKYGNLRASGIFSASHALASQGYIEPAKRLIQGLYDINPRPILEV